MKFLKLFLVFLIVTVTGFAQANVNIDALTDEQLQQFMAQAKLTGLSDAELETKAKEKGLSSDQIAKLRTRINNLSSSSSSNSSAKSIADTLVSRQKIVEQNIVQAKTTVKSKIFGAELFNNSNLTFEPNLKIPTPRNYVLGVGDVIAIDVFGYSDAKYSLRVNEEGLVRIPYVSPLKVTGLTFDDAQKKITQSLSKVYPEILTGKTSVQVSLGQIRTIRVTLIGEITKPGTYFLSSLSSIANALYVSGGPNENGSFRSIDLIRNGKKITTFDLYDFLLKGDLTNNRRLEDDDIVKVNPYTKRVELTGAIKRKAIYETKNGETLGSVIDFAGGFADGAYKEFFTVTRMGDKEKEIINITKNNYPSFELKSGDIIIVDSITNRFTNRVSINGSVFHPGNYALDNGTTKLSQLIAKAGLKEEAYLKRGLIKRLQDNFMPQAIDFNVADIINGKNDLDLRREDSIKIYSIFELQENYNIIVQGEVNTPGIYDYADSMKLQDALIIAGGLKDGATDKKIEISRRIKMGMAADSNAYAIVESFSLDEYNSRKTTLKPFDVITVRKDPLYKDQKIVTIQGEVQYPGKYILQNSKETMTDLITRAGGLKSSAYVSSAILLRNSYRDNLERQLAESKAYYTTSQSRDSTTKDIFYAEIKTPRQIVNIHLEKALAAPHGIDDIAIEEGDILKIPQYKGTVQTIGGVYVPRKINFNNELSFSDAISESGGFLTNAAKRKVFVQYPNGEVKKSHSFLFFRSYPKLKPGSEIFIPLKPERKPMSTGEIIGISSALAGMASIIYGIINLKK
ncbi:MAG: SLBB domain-containing protein [Bacteroidetes bacterium]|nr:SLBB domain-containing protein [Bacteroidota bacterium]MBS1627779.1 SLBB domain-containing protein [Bacteroidota bacterium]MBS1649812.1 SLBB domain-containing protein [Bacteroidota bacterium]